MTIDVGTTPRKPLTPRQRVKLYEAFGGICPLCSTKIIPGHRWRDEHLRALGLGGTNEWDNRAPVHSWCAPAKDRDDMARINKAKDQKAASLGIKPVGVNKIRSAGFRKFERQSRIANEPIDKDELPPLPRRNLATGEIIE